MNTKTYTVGWLAYTPEQLADFPSEYRDQIQYIICYGKSERNFYQTPGEAQWLLEQIAHNNSERNLKHLTPLGAQGLFIVERDLGDPPQIRFCKYVPPNNSHIIPSAPAQAGDNP